MTHPISKFARLAHRRRSRSWRIQLIVAACLLNGSGVAIAEDLEYVWRLALQNDPTYRQAIHLTKISSLNRKSALAATLPQIHSVYNIGRNDASQPSRTNSGGQLEPALDYTYDNEDVSVNVDQVLFDIRTFSAFGELRQAINAAESRLDNTKVETSLNAVDLYFKQLIAEVEQVSANAELTALAGQLEAALLRADLGAGSKITAQQIQARHDQAKARSILSKSNYVNARNQLWALTTRHFDHLAAAKTKLPRFDYQPEEIDHWVGVALANNPQVLAAVAGTKQARKMRGRVNGNFYPRISLNYRYGNRKITGTDQFEALFSEAETSSVSVQVDFPIFTGGGNIVESRIAAQRYHASVENEQYTRRNVENLIVQLWHNHSALYAAMNAYEAALVSAKSSLELITRGQNLGLNSTNDLLSAVSDKYNAEREYKIAVYDYLFNQVRFELATGHSISETIRRINSYLK